MIEKYLNNRFLTLYLFPFILGCLTVFSFQPYNFTFINFIILPIFFYFIIYIKKNQKASTETIKKNLFFFSTFLDLDTI